MSHLETPEPSAASAAKTAALKQELQATEINHVQSQASLSRQLFFASIGAYAAHDGDVYLGTQHSCRC